MFDGFCVWLTGLPVSGKTTLALLLEGALLERGLNVEVLGGREMRKQLGQDLGFTREDRDILVRRTSYVAGLLVRNKTAVIVAADCPYADLRREARDALGAFIEVYLNAPLQACIERDPEGLYDRAGRGDIRHVAGLDLPYEPPDRAELEIPTHEEAPEDSLARILKALEIMRLIPAVPGDGFSDEEAGLIEKRLSDLGYI